MIETKSTPKSKNKSKTHSGRFTDLDADKLRGGYYTPRELAEWMCNWAITDKSHSVLEPSCGEGAFLLAALERLAELGASKKELLGQLLAMDIIDGEAEKARDRLEAHLSLPARDRVKTADFFSWWNDNKAQQFDAVVGNPPFIRYQTFPEPHRSAAMDMMKELGLTPNRLTNIWVPFVVAASALLKPGGRLAMVLPAELLQVSYATQLRSFLTSSFGRVDLVACNELFFEGAQQEVVLLLADNAHPVRSIDNECTVTLSETNSVVELLKKPAIEILEKAEPKSVQHSTEKWLKYFLTNNEIEFMRELREAETTINFSYYAKVNVGVVTGKNEFFVLRESQLEENGLKGLTIPLISRSAHLKGACMTKVDWRKLSESDQLVHLLFPDDLSRSNISSELQSYIDIGEEKDFHKGYKCSIRDPWFIVPSIWIPDGFLFRQIYDFPRIISNTSGATCTDTIHRVKCNVSTPGKVFSNMYTHLTGASAEIEGRSYGGGVLELEPSEAGRLLMPRELSSAALSMKECDKLISDGRLDEVLLENDKHVLMKQLGLSRQDCKKLRIIWEKMRDRRIRRKKTKSA